MRSCVRIGLYCKKQFVDGDINDLLSGIDDLLFKKLVFGNMESRYSLSQLIHFLYYIYKRLEIQTNDNERFPFEGLAIKLVNQLADLIDASFFRGILYVFHLPISRTDINENPVLSYTI